MLVCTECRAPIQNANQPCMTCGTCASVRQGFTAWAPELADANNGFRAEYFSDLAQVESEHFWFRARNTLIVWAIKRYFPNFQSLLEIGCGSGFVLSGIAMAFPTARMVGSEIFVAGLEVAAKRMPQAELVQLDARKLPYVEEFEIVAAFDVIEHIEEDETVLQNFFSAIKPGGVCIVTVPQHKWLWSPVDEEACHKRRYSAVELHDKIEATGFNILRSTSFVTLLLPAMFASRLLARGSGKSGGTQSMRMNKFVNRLFEAILAAEQAVIKLGLDWPIGGSRLVVAKKMSSSSIQN